MPLLRAALRWQRAGLCSARCQPPQAASSPRQPTLLRRLLLPRRPSAAQCGAAAAAVAIAAATTAAPRAGCTTPMEVSNAELLAWMDEVERLEPGEVRKFVIQPLEAQRFSALASMAELGQARTLQTLLRAGANPRLGDRAHGRLPMHLAAWKGHAAVLEALLAHDPSLLEEPDKKYRGTPLTLAAMHGRLDAVRVLLAAGANREAVVDPPHASRQQAVAGKMDGIRITDLGGMTALHLAAMRGHDQVRSSTPLSEVCALRNFFFQLFVLTMRGHVVSNGTGGCRAAASGGRPGPCSRNCL